MSVDPHSNFALTTVSGAPSPATSGTSLTGTSLTNFPDPASVGAYNAVIWATGTTPISSNAEIVRVTAKSGSTLTITRAQEGSSARSVIIGDNIAIVVTKKTLTDVEGHATATRRLASLLSDSTAIASTTSKTAFSKTYSLPAGFANVAGTVVRVRASFTYSDTGTPTLAISVRIGATDFFINTAITLPSGVSNNVVSIEASFIVRSTGASATIKPGPGRIALNGSAQGNTLQSTFTKDLTGALTIDVTAQWGTSSASNTIVMTSMEVELATPEATIA